MCVHVTGVFMYIGLSAISVAYLALCFAHGKFLPNLAPLYKLLQKKVQWSWGKPQVAAFQQENNAGTHTNKTRDKALHFCAWQQKVKGG